MRKTRVLVTLIFPVIAAMVFFTGQGEGQTKAQSAPQKLVVWCHAVHQQVADGTRGTTGESATAEFEAKYNVKVEWVPLAFQGMDEKILREINLPRGAADVVFVVDNWASSNTLQTLEPLEQMLKKSPVEEAKDIPEGVWRTFALEGSQRALAYRSTPQILHYNKAIFDRRGISGPPMTIEQLGDYARRTTYTREDGGKVYGLGIKGWEDPIAFVRAFGGEVLTFDFKVKANQPETVQAITFLRDLYKAGAIPPDYLNISDPDYSTLFSEGLLAMTLHGADYNVRYNNPKQSKIVGSALFHYIPAAERTGKKIAPAKIAIWATAIPRNSAPEKKQLAFEFLRFFASKPAQLKLAVNGNGPVRESIYRDPQYMSAVKYAELAATVLPHTRPHLPPFGGTAEVIDMFKTQAAQAITGKKEVQKAMDEAAAAIETILRREGVK
jgi:multiple sugar transport system substrate-binding protein